MHIRTQTRQTEWMKHESFNNNCPTEFGYCQIKATPTTHMCLCIFIPSHKTDICKNCMGSHLSSATTYIHHLSEWMTWLQWRLLLLLLLWYLQPSNFLNMTLKKKMTLNFRCVHKTIYKDLNHPTLFPTDKCKNTHNNISTKVSNTLNKAYNFRSIKLTQGIR